MARSLLLALCLTASGIAVAQDCVQQWTGYLFYEWTEPFTAEDEEAWRQALTDGRAREAYDLVRDHGRFMYYNATEPLHACDTDLSRADVLHRLLLAAQGQAMPDAALSIADHALAREPELSTRERVMFLRRRACLMNHGAHDDAMRDMEEAIRLAPEEPATWSQLAYMKGGYVDAEGIFQRVHAARDVFRAIDRALALGAEDPDRFGAYLYTLTEAVGIYSGMPEAYGGDLDKALRLAREKAQLNPIVGNWDVGRVYARLGRYRKAVRHFNIAADQAGVNVNQQLELAFSLARVYLEMAREDEAFEVLYDIRDRFPHQSAALYQIGRAASLTKSRQAAGIDHLNRWLKHPSALNNAQGNCEFAPNFGFAHYHLGRLHDQLDEIGKAREHYNRALEYTPDFEDAKLALLRLPKGR